MATKAQGERTRQRLLDAATKSFAERGYRGTSLDAVASVAGVTRHALLHYFRSKDELLLAVLHERDEADRGFADAVRERTQHDLVARMVALLERYDEQPELARLVASAAGESVVPGHPAHDYFRRRYERVRASLADEIRGEQTRGRVSGDRDAESLAVAILALLSGLNVQRLLDPAVDARKALLEVLHAVLDGTPRAS